MCQKISKLFLTEHALRDGFELEDKFRSKPEPDNHQGQHSIKSKIEIIYFLNSNMEFLKIIPISYTSVENYWNQN